MKKFSLLISGVVAILYFSSCSNADNQVEEEDDNTTNEEIIYSTKAPFYPIDFEPEGYGYDWTWTVFENGNNPSIEIVENPDKSGINTSNKVAKFTAISSGAQWAGFESKHGVDIGSFTFDNTNAIVKVMIYKAFISDVGLKFAEANGEAQPEVKVANTKTNEWEELVFDMSNSIGKQVNQIDQIILFPDYSDRALDRFVYIDTITFHSKE